MGCRLKKNYLTLLWEKQMPNIQNIYAQYKKAVAKRNLWESTWQECYEYALPQRETNRIQK